MKLYNIIDLVKNIAHSIPNINTVFVGDVYDLNTIKDIEYSAIVITEQTHTINNIEEEDTYNLNIFYVDRQTSDGGNVLDIHSHGIEVLKMLLNQVEESGVVIANDYTVQTFKERFDSLCAGAYVNVALMVKSQTCGNFKLVTSVNGMVGDVIIQAKEPTSEIDYDDINTPTNSKAVVDYVEPLANKVDEVEGDLKNLGNIVNNIDCQVAAISGDLVAVEDRVSTAETKISTLQNTKQDNLISGTNIKTVNGNSLLGNGDLVIDSGSKFVGKLGSYTTFLSGFLNALSVKGAVSNFDGISKDAAKVGELFVIEAKAADTHDYYIFVLECETPKNSYLRGHTIYSYIIHDYELWKNKVTEITSDSTDTQYPSAKAVFDELQKKQDTLVSGTNIKTINGESILGSGDIEIQGGESAFDIESDGNGIGIKAKSTIYPNTIEGTIRYGITVLGYDNKASGYGSFVAGTNNSSLGSRNFVGGRYNKATNNSGIVLGYCNENNGSGSQIYGDYSLLNGTNSFILGANTVIDSNTSISLNAIGFAPKLKKTDTPYVYSYEDMDETSKNIIENGKYYYTSNTSSIAQRIFTYTVDKDNKTITTQTILNNDTLNIPSCTLGSGNINIGLNVQNVGNQQLGIGLGNTIDGDFSQAHGLYNHIKGKYNLSFGRNNRLLSSGYSNAFGEGLTTKERETVLGQYNLINEGLANKRLVTIGGGLNEDNKYNILESFLDDTHTKVNVRLNASKDIYLNADDKVYYNGDELATERDIDEIKDKIDEIELSKFPNATIFGQPIIQQGQISNFSAENYLQFPFMVDFQNRDWQIDMEVTMGADVTGQHNILDSNFGLAFAVQNTKLVMAISHTGTSWDGAYTSSLSIEPNKTYRIKMSWNTNTYKVDVSDNNTDWVNYISVENTNSLYPRTMIIGKSLDNRYIWNGSINFNYCSLTISDKVVWQGMDDAGLATRMAVNMNNIDDEGKQVIKDIVNEVIKPNYDFKFIYLGQGAQHRTFLLTNPIGYILAAQDLNTLSSFFYDMFKMVRNVATTDYPTITTLQDMYIDDVFTPANTVIKNDGEPDFEGRKIRLIRE